MANYTSKYTGAQIDLAVSSGSSVSGKIIDVNLVSGSGISTGSLSRLEVADNADIKGVLSLPNIANVSSSIAAAALGGDNLGNHTATQALNMDGNSIISASFISASNISASRLTSYDDITLKDGSQGGDTLVRIYDSGGGSTDDGVIDVYQNNIVKSRIHGNGLSHLYGGGLKVSGSNGFISASGNLVLGGDIIFSSTGSINKHIKVLGSISSSGPVQIGNASGQPNAYFLAKRNPTSFIRVGAGYSGGDQWIRWSDTDNLHLGVTSNDGNQSIDTIMYLSASGKVGIGASGSSLTKALTVEGDISASGDLYVGGNDIYGGTTKRITLGTTNEIVGHITSSGNIRAEGQISASGEIVTKNSFKIKQGSLNSGDVILKAYSSGDDGVIDVYQNNAVKSRIHGNGVSHLYGGGLLVSQSANATISASGRIVSGDSFLLKHGSNIDGDTRVKIYGSSDDGIIDVYQNNAVKK